MVARSQKIIMTNEARVLRALRLEHGLSMKRAGGLVGKPERHFFELYLGAQDVEHRTTRPASPYTNGFAERFHRTLKDEFFAKVFREKIYGSIEELQRDLDAFIEFYNTGRVHSGYRCEGRTPMQALKDLLSEPKSETTEVQAA